MEVGTINKSLKNTKNGKQLSKTWTDFHLLKNVSKSDYVKFRKEGIVLERVLCKVTDSKNITFTRVDDFGNLKGIWNKDFLTK